MGSTSSKAKDTINSVINSSIGVYTDDVQTCNETSNNALNFTQDTSIGGTQTTTGVNFDSTAIMNQSCMADFKASDDVSQQVTQDFQQAAQSINDGLNIGVNSTDAETITNLMTNLSTTMSNSFDQAASVVSSNVLSISQFAHCDSTQSNAVCDPAKQLISDISFKSYSDQIQSAVEKVTTSSKIMTQLDEAISQVTEAENKGLSLEFIAAIIAAVVVVLALLEYTGVKIIDDLTTTWPGMIISLVIVYLVIAAVIGFFPFKRDGEPSGHDISLACVINSDCGDGFTCVHEICRLTCDTDADCTKSDDDVAMTCDMGGCVAP